MNPTQHDSVAVLRAIRMYYANEPGNAYTLPSSDETVQAIDAAITALQSQQGASADRGEAVEEGPWTAERENGKWLLQSEDFTHDARLYINGDFASDEQEQAYAELIAARLNATPPSPAESAARNAWFDAVTDACTIACIDWDESDPRGTLDRLIAWREEIALDPRVSDRANALRAYASPAESADTSTGDDARHARENPPPLPPATLLYENEGDGTKVYGYTAEQMQSRPAAPSGVSDALAVALRAERAAQAAMDAPGSQSGTIDAYFDARDLTDAILASQPQPGRVEGIVLVPVDPLLAKLREVLGADGSVYREIKAMLAATPTAGGQEADHG